VVGKYHSEKDLVKEYPAARFQTPWRIGLLLSVGGWILLFAGHRIEGNKQAFFQGVVYFLVGTD
jgi:uncharacterized membrane protein YGL010W